MIGREQRGKQIANSKGQVKRLSEEAYKVKSQNRNGTYDVLKTESGWMCSCPDHTYRNVKCKHIWAVEFSTAIRQKVEEKKATHQIIDAVTGSSNCLYCGSENILRDGVRHNKHGDIQKYVCRDCGRYFTINIGFEKMKHNPQAITSAMQLYFSGESLRNTMRSLRLLGVQVSHQTVYNWISKYVSLMKEYVEKITPSVGDTWRADELYVKVKGDMKYLFALMDDETRFWIAQEVADTKHRHDAGRLFQMGKEATGKSPKTLITDGLAAYQLAYKREFWTREKAARTEHVRDIHISGDKNNNKMERLNGEIRDREKVMRGLKRRDSPVLTGYQIYHNYIRPHEGLKGKTPADACGIGVGGDNKWLTLIQNASKKTYSSM
jgi:transposase-like protein